jgi:hypothetical protein
VHICDVSLALAVVREQPGRLCQRVGRFDVIDVDWQHGVFMSRGVAADQAYLGGLVGR